MQKFLPLAQGLMQRRHMQQAVNMASRRNNQYHMFRSDDTTEQSKNDLPKAIEPEAPAEKLPE
jgi:hypothetical protein